jgi:hypothetical protein
MMGAYLEKLRALKLETGLGGAPSKPSKPISAAAPVDTSTGGIRFEGFEGAWGVGFSNLRSPPAEAHSTTDAGLTGGYSRVFAALESRCPDLVPAARWQSAVEDGRRFLGRWGDQAEALGWTSKDLFGLFPAPANPHPSFARLSRYDATGLVWLLRGRGVVALTAETAAIQGVTGAVTVYRRFRKPALGPLGDSLDDLDPSPATPARSE